MNKFVYFFALLFCLSAPAFAQETKQADQPIYLRFPSVPQFVLAKAPDSTAFTRDHLRKRANTLFFIFSPDCSYCKYETTEILKNIKKFKDANIVMITYFPWDQMMPYYEEFQIAKYPQITMARDNNYFFPTFFSMKNFPSTFIYDKKGNFKKAFDGAVKIEEILKEL